MSKNGWYLRWGKRAFDVALGGISLPLWLPPLGRCVGCTGVHWDPCSLSAAATGVGGRPFTLYKFRTMAEERDAEGWLLPDEQRLTPFGRFLRSTSLDELPELFNVLRGDMNLIGPRPLLIQYLDRYTPEQMRRHDVKPGITGWAQVNGRNAINWEEKFVLDVWYVDHQSLWLDLKILTLTIWKILKREGISQPGHETAEEFMGSRS